VSSLELSSPAQADLFPGAAEPLEAELAAFTDFGKATVILPTEVEGETVPTFVNEFWTSRQRAASNLHEVSYRACFKPQLPRFFIERLTEAGEVVYDPFMGRGTTCLEAALLGRVPCGCDINPLSKMLLEPRLLPPSLSDVAERLESIDLSIPVTLREDLLVFYHADTLQEICALRHYLLQRAREGTFDLLDGWIRTVAINRLTGHSPGFFSVYSLPPNQAVSIKSQIRINTRRQQTPPRRDIRQLIMRKSRQLLKECGPETRTRLASVFSGRRLLTALAGQTPEIEDNSVALVVTSPPFLDVVDYAGDNWLRLWFAGVDGEEVALTMTRKVEAWEREMGVVFKELMRILRPGGHVAFEVGEVRSGTVRLEEAVVRAARSAGLKPRLILINDQAFTKTAHCWGVNNGEKGTNTNRVVLLVKEL
jgi:hypothetical protein